ncbi:tetratricopeptide repeat protein [Lebetimonas sp. JS032]|uniref:tetratricopeptide repeat protein n=1 Tax=Lebetimonas sp. JS032 TaxID=990070 RepID=UPI0004653D14|nr:tetratricopeptide repeat protein [Lebetimonas sp. JS032]
MAEEENVIIIEEDNKKKKKYFLIIIILLLIALILLLVLTFAVIKKKKENNIENKEITEIAKKLEKKHIQKDTLKTIIKKAAILYKNGQKKKALELLNKVSSFSQSLSNYNLGVIKMKEGKFNKALKFFQKAINNKENRVVSAINAAVCALKLKNKKLFDYYINLAYITLPEIAKSKSYPYYYALVMYYMGYEQEAIPALKMNTPYREDSQRLLSAIYEYNNNFIKAQDIQRAPFYKGLDLAEIGEYSLAKHYLSISDKKKAKFALALVDLKLSEFKEASILFKNFDENNVYPIRINLKPSLFDVKVAQKEFKNSFLAKKSDYYDLFFYFAPFKVYSLNQTIAYLKKGIAGIPIGAIEESNSYLSKSAVYSGLNLEISKAIKLALNGHIYLANKKFQTLIKKRDTSYILHYNLALTYAQLGDYKQAYFHFLRAYHLNPGDMLSGIYALMAVRKTGRDDSNLLASLKEDLNGKNVLEYGLISLINNNTVGIAAFLEKNEKPNPLWILAKLAGKAVLNENYLDEALKLKSMFNRDIIANLLYFYAENKNLSVKKLALNFQSLFLEKNWDMNDFYYGAKVVRDWYFEFAKISGLLNKVRFDLEKKAKIENFDVIPLLKRLAFANLYTKHFEESYVIYNDLINNKNVDDPFTLYQAAVAGIGANHHANAVALMELAKLKNPTYSEARYGLGLLWQEANNIRAARIQYSKIPDGFESKYFDFNIKPPNSY